MKLWLIKYEVLAEDLKEALAKSRGRIYSVEEASKEYQPEELKKVGFTDAPSKKSTK